jgi:hypothetical protein
MVAHFHSDTGPTRHSAESSRETQRSGAPELFILFFLSPSKGIPAFLSFPLVSHVRASGSPRVRALDSQTAFNPHKV